MSHLVKERTLIAFLVFAMMLGLATPLRSEYLKINDYSSGVSHARFWSLKKFGKQKVNVVFIGDSRTSRGVSPRIVDNFLPDNMDSYNSGFSIGGLNKQLFKLAQSKLTAKKNNNLVIALGVTPLSLTPKACRNSHLNQIRYKGRLSSSFSRIDATLIMQLTKKVKSKHRTYAEYFEDGWCATNVLPPIPTRTFKCYRRVFDNNQVSSKIISAFYEQVRTWKKRGITVIGFRPPTTIGMVKIENEKSGFKEKDFITGFTSAGGSWLNVPLDGYTSYDGSHLDEKSARKLSCKIGKFIATELGKK